MQEDSNNNNKNIQKPSFSLRVKQAHARHTLYIYRKNLTKLQIFKNNAQ